MKIFIAFIIIYIICLTLTELLIKNGYDFQLNNATRYYIPLGIAILGAVFIFCFDMMFAPAIYLCTITGIKLIHIFVLSFLPIHNIILLILSLADGFKHFNKKSDIISYLSFNQFKNIYLIDPKSWNISQYHCEYIYNYCYRAFGFKTIIDYYKYLKFLRQLDKQKVIDKKNKAQRAKDEQLALVLIDWTKKIEQYRIENAEKPLEKIKSEN